MPDEPKQPHSELASFGEELRREREIRGISLKEIADATKISKRFLEAIERNDHRMLPAPVFTRGFVREYARYLGLNADEIVNRYNFAAAGDDRIEKSPHLERLVQPPAPPLPPKERERRSIPPAYARIDRNVYVLVVIVAALIAVSLWALKHKREARAEEARVDTAAASTIAPKAPPSAPVPAPVPEPPPVEDTLKLTIDVSRDSWVTLQADGKTVIDEELRAGDHRVVEAREAFRFVAVGNAGGLALKLNEFDLPALGRARQVVKDRVFDRGTLQELQSESHKGT